jgi:choline dehydrogenase-like flavoprotein
MCRASQSAIFGYVTERHGLYVVNTSFFPSIGAMNPALGAVNPALAAMANAIRVGDHLMSRMA